ncbi:MAG: hypothetical protein QXU32_01240 [Nitrososphaerales archaeon]
MNSESIDKLYAEAERRLKEEHDRAIEKIKEELKAAKQKALR